MIKTFLCEPTSVVQHFMLRTEAGSCPLFACHRVERVHATSACDPHGEIGEIIQAADDDPNWPVACGCGFMFTEHSRKSHMAAHQWKRTDTGEVKDHVRDFGVGAMYFARWFPTTFYWDNATEPLLHVITPGGEWCIDGRASNCMLPNDRTHRCWVRHGTPPDIHVDKNGHTCAAGAGSIAQPGFHGFLHNGYITSC